MEGRVAPRVVAWIDRGDLALSARLVHGVRLLQPTTEGPGWLPHQQNTWLMGELLQLLN